MHPVWPEQQLAATTAIATTVGGGKTWGRMDEDNDLITLTYPQAVPSPFPLWVKASWAGREKRREQSMISE